MLPTVQVGVVCGQSALHCNLNFQSCIAYCMSWKVSVMCQLDHAQPWLLFYSAHSWHAMPCVTSEFVTEARLHFAKWLHLTVIRLKLVQLTLLLQKFSFHLLHNLSWGLRAL